MSPPRRPARAWRRWRTSAGREGGGSSGPHRMPEVVRRDTLDVTGSGHRSGHASTTLADVRTITPIRAVPDADPGPGARVRLEGDRILIDGLTVHDPALAAFLGRATGRRPAGSRRAGRADRPARAPGRGRHRQRGRRARRVREAHAPGRIRQREGGPGARADPARQLRRRRRPAAPNAREVPRRPGRAALDGRRAVRRDQARQRHRPDRLDARALLRWRRLEAGRPARPDPAALADAPVPPGDDRRVPLARGAPRGDRGRRRGPWRRACPVDGQGRRLRGPPRGDAGRPRPRDGRPARPDRAPRRAPS